MGSARGAIDPEAASLSCATVVVVLAADRHDTHSGSRRPRRGGFDCALDPLFASCQSCPCSGARLCIVGGLPARSPTGTSACWRRTEMRLIKAVLAVIGIISLCSPASAQSRRLLGGSAGGSKYQFFYDTFLEPSVPELGNLGGGTIGGEGTIHRLMWDRRQRVYFGYDVAIEPLVEPNTYRITFGELTLSSDDAHVLGGDPSSWTPLPAPDWGGPAVRTVRAGEVLALDLLTNDSTGQKIVDYVTVQGPSAKSQA